MNFLDEDDRNAAIELLKANALATANNNSLHTTIREEPNQSIFKRGFLFGGMLFSSCFTKSTCSVSLSV
jgi:hypothetical protein